MASHSSVLFREIYKNAWLRKIPSNDKKTGTSLKKVDRIWTVFCVHDDTEPFLELYSDQKLAAAHRPDSTISLGSTLHISPTICPQDDEFQFVITLPSDVIRLAASSWDIMIDWVDTLSCKLREMHILSPKENIYSRNPEARPPLLPTRDPNSPLPLPPTGSASHVPGVEIVQPHDNELSSGLSSHEGWFGSIQEETATPISANNIVSLTVSTLLPSSEFPNSSRNHTAITQVPPVSGLRENVTVIEVSSEPVQSCIGNSVFDFSFVGAALEPEEEFYTPPVTPVLPRASIQRHHVNSVTASSSDNSSLVTIVPTTSPASSTHCPENTSENPVTDQNEDSLYEHVYLTDAPTSPVSCRPQISGGRNKHHGRNTNNRNRIGESSTSNQGESHDRGRTNMLERDINERRCLVRNPALQPPPQPFPRCVSIDTTHRLTLREQQVLQLRKEMLHAGGVRLQLRRKDCIGSIALIDAFNAVWIAGWKQKDHPMLYNALHIGDQLISVAGILVQNANDAQRLIRGAPSLYVELIVRRVPCGRVYALQRESEGQDLGIVQEGKTAEIREIIAGSIAALGGMTSRTLTVDRLSLTTCVLTEINGRPLNLFFKDNEVRDRLNAVGLDISLLVQPSDLIKQIKKQLKSLRNYKDYIVQ